MNLKKYIVDSQKLVKEYKILSAREDVLLTREEKFDLSFKSLLGRVSNPFKLKDKDYRVAKFYADTVLLMDYLTHEGYSAKSLVKAFKQVRDSFFFISGKYVTIYGEDKNNVISITAKIDNSLSLMKITNVPQMQKYLLAFATACVSVLYRSEPEYIQTFVEAYLGFVYKELRKGIVPTLYYHKGEVNTLEGLVKGKENTVSKVINFKAV